MIASPAVIDAPAATRRLPCTAVAAVLACSSRWPPSCASARSSCGPAAPAAHRRAVLRRERRLDARARRPRPSLRRVPRASFFYLLAPVLALVRAAAASVARRRTCAARARGRAAFGVASVGLAFLLGARLRGPARRPGAPRCSLAVSAGRGADRAHGPARRRAGGVRAARVPRLRRAWGGARRGDCAGGRRSCGARRGGEVHGRAAGALVRRGAPRCARDRAAWPGCWRPAPPSMRRRSRLCSPYTRRSSSAGGARPAPAHAGRATTTTCGRAARSSVVGMALDVRPRAARRRSAPLRRSPLARAPAPCSARRDWRRWLPLWVFPLTVVAVFSTAEVHHDRFLLPALGVLRDPLRRGRAAAWARCAVRRGAVARWPPRPLLARPCATCRGVRAPARATGALRRDRRARLPDRARRRDHAAATLGLDRGRYVVAAVDGIDPARAGCWRSAPTLVLARRRRTTDELPARPRPSSSRIEPSRACPRGPALRRWRRRPGRRAT